MTPQIQHELYAPDDLLSDVWLSELARPLPELADRYPDLQIASGEEAAARVRLFEAVARLGQAIAALPGRLVVLFVGDVQCESRCESGPRLACASRASQTQSTLDLIRFDAFSQEGLLSRVCGQLERALISHASSPAFTQITKELRAGRVKQVIVSECLGERIHFGEGGLRPTEIAQRDRSVQAGEW